MNLFIEIKAEHRKSSETCIKEILNIENIFKEKLLDNKKINCVICGQLLSNDFRIACRIYKSKKVMLNPVHKTCMEENVSLLKIITNNNDYKDISDKDLISSIKIIEKFHEINKNG